MERAVLAHLRRHLESTDAPISHLLGTGLTAELEARLCTYYGKRHALLTASATSALSAIARIIGVTDREVITPPLSWGGTVAPFVQAGAALSFADVDGDTLTLCPDAAGRAWTPTTHVVLGVDLFGVPADDERLRALAEERNLWYIHDGSHSFGAMTHGRPAGSQAHALVLSFGPGKPLYAGEGGAVVTDDTWLYERLVHETQHPYRHRRELGLGEACETALHARAHPLAVAWALASFDEALARVRRRQATIARLFDIAVSAGLVEPPPYASRGLAPSFTRVTGVWRDRRCWSRLQSVLDRAELPWEVVPPALTLLPALPTVPAPLDVALRCAVAYGASDRRFELIELHTQEAR